MSRSVALSPQFGNAVVFGSGSGRLRRRAKSVHVPVPEGLRVVAVCVPDEVEEAARTRAGRTAPHRRTGRLSPLDEQAPVGRAANLCTAPGVGVLTARRTLCLRHR